MPYPAQEDRSGLLSAVFSREGVLDVDAGQLRVQQRGAGANFSVDVTAGRAAIVGDNSSDQGTYVVTGTTTENVATFSTGTAITAPGSGTRQHRVIARVRDKLHNGAVTTYDWILEILQDTGSGAPAQPASAITLAFLNMTAGMTSIQTANIVDGRPRASVGTPARQGTLSFISAYTPDALRPPSYHVNPDGWVSLSGFVLWNGTAQTIPAGTFSDAMLTAPVPAAIRPTTYRDMTMTSVSVPVHAVIRSDGQLYWRPWWAYSLVPASTWWSLDGMGYRL